MAINKALFEEKTEKDLILCRLSGGYTSEWAPQMPLPWKHVNNYFPPHVKSKCRQRFQDEIKKGRMLGGIGWTREEVTKFLGKSFYVIPCGAVPKNGDPFGRIIHDFSYAGDGLNSINTALIDNSVRYISFIERVRSLSKVLWYVVVDLKNGYRQLPVHPSEWFSQIYSLGKNEHFIDLCMPFGKANSAKIFCHWVENWVKAFKLKFHRWVHWDFELESYVDDIFGGANTKENAKELKEALIAVGELTSTKMNLKKCHGPATSLTILGMLFDSAKQNCRLCPKKTIKYTKYLEMALLKNSLTTKELEKLVGYVSYASWVEPFGRPFISPFSSAMLRSQPEEQVVYTEYMIIALKIWILILKANMGVSYNFLLSKLPNTRDEWFVDASTSWGIGGCCGYKYFSINKTKLFRFFELYNNCNSKSDILIPYTRLPIAYLELLAALVGLAAFSALNPNSIVRLNSDNTDVVSWLKKGRCKAGIGFRILAAIELLKKKFNLKISPRYIPGSKNTSADALSRGTIPTWLCKHGQSLTIDLDSIFNLVSNPLEAWESLIN